MNYQTFKPSESLSAFVKCYWTLDCDTESHPGKQRILPDGCMEMIFHYGDAYHQYMPDGTTILQPMAFVFGQITQALEIEPTGRSGIFAVRFHPHGFIPFATLPLSLMENKAVPLKMLFDDDGLKLEKEIRIGNTTALRIEKTEAFLLNRLTLPETSSRLVQTVIGTMFELRGQLSISDLTDFTGINRRQLERKFSSATGLSPKQLAKFIRLQEVLKNLLDAEKNNLTRVGYESDYYDQSHFIHDFKAFTGVSPKAFYSGKLKMAALFSKKV